MKEGYTEDNTVRQLAIQEAYETTYGIHNHETSTEHYALNAMHPTIQTVRHFHHDNAIRRFISTGVYGTTGISLDKFMAQPHWLNELIYEAVLDDQIRKSKIAGPLPPLK